MLAEIQAEPLAVILAEMQPEMQVGMQAEPMAVKFAEMPAMTYAEMQA